MRHVVKRVGSHTGQRQSRTNSRHSNASLIEAYVYNLLDNGKTVAGSLTVRDAVMYTYSDPLCAIKFGTWYICKGADLMTQTSKVHHTLLWRELKAADKTTIVVTLNQLRNMVENKDD